MNWTASSYLASCGDDDEPAGVLVYHHDQEAGAADQRTDVRFANNPWPIVNGQGTSLFCRPKALKPCNPRAL